MTEIMPVPRNFNFTVLPAESLRRVFFIAVKTVCGVVFHTCLLSEDEDLGVHPSCSEGTIARLNKKISMRLGRARTQGGRKRKPSGAFMYFRETADIR